MNAGIVVEGASDGSAYPVLIQRIRNDLDTRQVRECSGKSRLKNRFINFLKEFQRNHAWQIDAAFVILDSDCNPSQPIEARLRNIQNASGFAPGFHVVYFATQCMLESWLLSDLDAIRAVAAQRGHVGGVLPLSIQVGIAHNAADKEIFIRVLNHFGLPATPPVYGEIAAIADLIMIGNRCSYFREFMRRIRAL